MRNAIAVLAAVVLFVVGLSACAYAQVSASVGATCTKTAPATPTMGKAQTINVSANIVSSVTVKLSATNVDWKVTSSGNYKDPIINIGVTNPNGHDVVMHVAGAANLKNANGKTIDTSYGLTANWKDIVVVGDVGDMVTAVTCSTEPPSYQAAANFNGAHALKPSFMSTLWNKIKVDDNLPTGTYSNKFTVTFSEQL